MAHLPAVLIGFDNDVSLSVLTPCIIGEMLRACRTPIISVYELAQPHYCIIVFVYIFLLWREVISGGFCNRKRFL